VAQGKRDHSRCDGELFNVLEGNFTVVLANPEEVKNRKGHKTDRKDAELLADWKCCSIAEMNVPPSGDVFW
jgi:hypothetical protein